jgi:radical SAM superfamily enzyme YgiQ (UPF0313 family)
VRIPGGRSTGLSASEVVLTPEAALPDLARLPMPDRRGEPAACFGHGIAPLVSSRGCYANCYFCCIAAWHEQSLPGKRYRLRDVAAVADEMVALKARGHGRSRRHPTCDAAAPKLAAATLAASFRQPQSCRGAAPLIYAPR